MAKNAKTLRSSLKEIGLTDAAINAAWPDWWSDAADASLSAGTELRFSLARKFGLDPKSLLEDRPKFVWHTKTKFKNLSSEEDSVKGALASFGGSVGGTLIQGTHLAESILGISALKIREMILAARPFVGLQDLLGFAWAVGIPVIHLRVFPLSAKHMCAMVTRVGRKFAILLAKDAEYPAPIAYYLAHEIGHIALGHLQSANSLVDLKDPLDAEDEGDDEERDADRFALELLTGKAEFEISTETKRYTSAQLAEVLLKASPELKIEPGTLALCFGHSTKEWAKAMAAMKLIYTASQPVWSVVNTAAAKQIDWSAISEDSGSFARAVMGGVK